ncbi:MAG: hypothetical protein K0R54_5885 [Clostridiaceae bacterium]|jgi:hypothetical protein|nr:hypothetical protein [Clostridiaceae bacterium]
MACKYRYNYEHIIYINDYNARDIQKSSNY